MATEDLGIGTRLTAARKRLGWSREALAFHSGISWSGVAQAESGRRRNLRPDTISALADALGVTIDYLVRGGPATSPMLDHKALLYSTDEEFMRTAGPFLAEGLERSEAVLAVTNSKNIELLREHLGSDAGEVEFIEMATWYSSPATVLDSFGERLSAKLGTGAPWVRILGEPVWEGRSRSETHLWTRYESMLNLVFAAWPATIICPYDERSVSPEIASQACVTHPQVIDRGGTAASLRYADPGQFVL
jgi:transcriptional regulator with XRE-family HTH domain